MIETVSKAVRERMIIHLAWSFGDDAQTVFGISQPIHH
jgi:hypothetical protein